MLTRRLQPSVGRCCVGRRRSPRVWGQFPQTPYVVRREDTDLDLSLSVSDGSGNTTVATVFSGMATTCLNVPALDAVIDPVFEPASSGQSLASADTASIFFANVAQNGVVGGTELNALSIQQLQIVVAGLDNVSTATYTIQGHTSQCGTNEANLALGQMRADAVLAYLVSQGVSATRLRTVSYGEERPFCTDNDLNCFKSNARVFMVQSGSRASNINSFTATPEMIVSGGTTTLDWQANGATSCSISGLGAVNCTGSLILSPSATTEYTLSATSPEATDRESVTVTVAPPR